MRFQKNMSDQKQVLSTGTTGYTIHFDFRNKEQRRILDHLQQCGYKLLGYKGATANAQKAEVPVWFSVPYIKMFGEVHIESKPLYKFFCTISPKNIHAMIQMDVLSEEIQPGSKVTLHADGTFSIDSGAPADTVSFWNDQAPDTPDIKVGLAAFVNGAYAPFCVFTSAPQKSLNIVPNEKNCLFAVPTTMRAGSVAENALAAGCMFELNASDNSINMEMTQCDYGLHSVSKNMSTVKVNLGQPLRQVLASCH